MAEGQNKSVEMLSLENQLKENRELKIKEFTGELGSRIDTFMKAHERVEGEEFDKKRDYAKKSQQLTDQLLEMAKDQEKEKGKLDIKHFTDKQEELLNRLKSRVDLAFEIAEESKLKGDEKALLSTFDEFARLNELKAIVDEETDVSRIMKESLEGAEMVAPSNLDILKKFKDGEIITQKELAHVLVEVRKISKMPPLKPNQISRSMHKYPGLLFIGYMKPKDRMHVLEKILDDKNTLKTIISLTATNHLSVEQGEVLIKKLAAIHPDQDENCLKAMELINSDKFRAYKAEVEKIKTEAEKSLSRNLDKNYAGKLLSLKGLIIWELGRGLGVATLIANVLANVNVTNIFNPSKWGEVAGEVADLATNPGVLGAIAVLGVSLESISGGIGRGYVTKSLGRLLKDKSETPETKQKKKMELMRTVITDWRHSSKFYFHNSKDIVGLFGKNKNPEDVTLKNLGLSFKSLPPELQKEVKEEATLNKILQEFAVVLYDNEMGIGIQTHDKQKEFINESRDSRGLTQFS